MNDNQLRYAWCAHGKQDLQQFGWHLYCQHKVRLTLFEEIQVQPKDQRSQIISEQAADMARYSDSVEDLETLACFLLFHEIKEEPRNMHQPVTKRRVSGHPAQSASL